MHKKIHTTTGPQNQHHLLVLREIATQNQHHSFAWQPASDPWSHRRPCVKPQPDISKRVASSDQVIMPQKL
eukprot:367516-Pelagomonas_calceolata.AAC.6